MNPGLLDRKITIQKPTITRGSDGAAVESWSDLVTVWANRRDLTGREFLAAQHQIVAEGTVIFTIRYLEDITVRHRIVEGSTVYDILQIAETQRARWLEITAKARLTP